MPLYRVNQLDIRHSVLGSDCFLEAIEKNRRRTLVLARVWCGVVFCGVGLTRAGMQALVTPSAQSALGGGFGKS